MSHEHGFKAEVQQLLDLMIHSLYSDREIFLRELVSNSADALDRARFLALTRDDLVPPEGDTPGIRIRVDAEANTVTIEDDGVGMGEVEAVENLGTIAHSGSKAFLEALKDKKEKPSFIGQFGVGFYSAFMVADEVVVESRSALPDEEPVLWRSAGQGTYTLEKGDRAHRGTRITLHLREDATEFAEAQRIQHLIRRYSNFLPWPIQVGDEQANAAKALWLEPPHQVSDEEANDFYKSLSFDFRDPALRVHVAVDSPIQYNALLFVPSDRPFDLFLPEADRGPRLYARRVLILEHAKELLPDWLRFVRGVVSSEDIALNVSRELVQRTPVVRKIREALTKRVLKELGKLADKQPETYAEVWKNFGLVLKEGYYHAHGTHGERILPLLRFNAASHDEASETLSLAAYKEAMPEDQDTIWYLTAPSRKSALASPHLEAFQKKGWDILLLTDPVDEWLVNVLSTFDDLPIKSVARGDLDLEDEPEAEADDTEKVDLDALAPWLHELYGEAVAGVRPSSRLTDSPCVLVDDEAGISSNMERILRQANQEAPAAARYLELNPRHPLIRDLTALHAAGRSEVAEPIARLLLDDALLLEGKVDEPAEIGKRLQDLLARAAASAVAQ